MSKTMEQYSAMAAKGKALVDAFYPAPSSDGRGGRPGEVSLSSDEKTFRDGRGGSDRSIQRSRNHFLHWEGQGGEQEGGSERESARERGHDTAEVESEFKVDGQLTEAQETDSDLVTRLRQELHRVQVGSLSTIASLRSRLAWFADNQVRGYGVDWCGLVWFGVAESVCPSLTHITF